MLLIDIEKKIKNSRNNLPLRINASVAPSKITGVFGNSGIGKTTLFNCLAGLTLPDGGRISFGDKQWFLQNEINLITQKRNIGFIFQRDNLFPHFNVKENIFFAVDKQDQKEIDLDQLLVDVGIEGIGESFPDQLSIGQQQRVAIARTLVQKSKVILMDEPFSALDMELKYSLFQLIKSFQEKYQLMILIISHDANDILELCEEVLWIKEHQAKGVIPIEVFKNEIDKLKLK